MKAAARNGSEYQMRRSVPICQRIRIDSANDGGVSSVWTTASLAPVGGPFPVTASRFPHPQAEEHEDDVGTKNTMNGTRQPEPVPEEAADHRPDERADGQPDRVEAEHFRADVRRVVVGEQRVVRRRDHGPADAGTFSHDHEHQHRRGERGDQPEDGPHRAAGECHRDAGRRSA